MTVRGSLRNAETFLFCVLCVTGLWGQAGRLLPAPFDDWYSIPYRVVGHFLIGLLPARLTLEETLALYQVIEAYILAFLLPLLLLGSLGLAAAGTGLRRPAYKGAWVTLVGVLLTLPVGFWLATVTVDPWGSALKEFLQYLSLLPEHFLIFGVCGALLLPERRLGWPPRGSQQTASALFAVLATGVIFGLVHIGGPHPEEIVASFALGLLFASMTILSGSVWPAIVAHCTLNLIPMAVLPP